MMDNSMNNSGVWKTPGGYEIIIDRVQYMNCTGIFRFNGHVVDADTGRVLFEGGGAMDENGVYVDFIPEHFAYLEEKKEGKRPENAVPRKKLPVGILVVLNTLSVVLALILLNRLGLNSLCPAQLCQQ